MAPPTTTAERSTQRRRSARGRPRDRAVESAVLEATEQLLARRGYEAMTMEQVAATAGVSKPTIYLRYSSKAALVAAMIDGLEPPLPTPGGHDARTDLIQLFRAGQEWVDRHGLRLVAAVLLEETDHPELMQRFRQRVVVPVRDAFKAALESGMSNGELRGGAADEEVIDALTGAYWAHAWAVGAPGEHWAPRLVDALLAGLRAR